MLIVLAAHYYIYNKYYSHTDTHTHTHTQENETEEKKEKTDGLRLTIPPWVGAMGTSESWGVNRQTT